MNGKKQRCQQGLEPAVKEPAGHDIKQHYMDQVEEQVCQFEKIGIRPVASVIKGIGDKGQGGVHVEAGHGEDLPHMAGRQLPDQGIVQHVDGIVVIKKLAMKRLQV